MSIVTREMKFNEQWVEVDVFYTKEGNSLKANKVKLADKMIDHLNLSAKTLEGLLIKVHDNLQNKI